MTVHGSDGAWTNAFPLRPVVGTSRLPAGKNDSITNRKQHTGNSWDQRQRNELFFELGGNLEAASGFEPENNDSALIARYPNNQQESTRTNDNSG
jgi:hypothetical protein